MTEEYETIPVTVTHEMEDGSVRYGVLEMLAHTVSLGDLKAAVERFDPTAAGDAAIKARGDAP